jgi:AcrR family transcriptional regulator
VLDAVVALFWEKGFEATSVADIVEATGLNKS